MPAKSAENHLEVQQVANVTVVNFLTRSVQDRDIVRSARKEFLAQVPPGEGQLLLNFANVEYLDGEALSELIALHKELEHAGHQLTLSNLHPSIEEVLRGAHLLDKLFHVNRATSSTQAIPKPGPAVPGFPGPASPQRDDANVAVVVADANESRSARICKGFPAELLPIPIPNLERLAEHCRLRPPAAVIMPLHWASPSGGEKRQDAPTLQFLRAHGGRTTVLVFAPTNQLSIETYCQALAAGAKQIVNEEAASFPEELHQAVARLLDVQRAAGKEREELIGLFAAQGVIGASASMVEVFRRALKAAQFHDLPILIEGETGTGKQRLAEAIHRLDPKRSTKPFITLNCSAVTKTLAESELFGHTKGAFSGAQAERPGIFQMADGGTLLLDEIMELDLELQPKLLRVLQEHRLLPVGADYERSVDVRIIAATNRSLRALIDRGQFREDLFQRLNVFRIYIPPLRERLACIEVQARHFLKIHQIGRERRVTDFGLRVLEALRLLPWEGNSRQLENFIRETLAHKDQGTLLQMEDLPHWVLETLARLRPHAPEVDSRETLVEKVYEKKMTLAEAMQEFERRLLQVVLERNGGNRTLTAAELGMTPRSILNKIKKFGLQ